MNKHSSQECSTLHPERMIEWLCTACWIEQHHVGIFPYTVVPSMYLLDGQRIQSGMMLVISGAEYEKLKLMVSA